MDIVQCGNPSRPATTELQMIWIEPKYDLWQQNKKNVVRKLYVPDKLSKFLDFKPPFGLAIIQNKYPFAVFTHTKSLSCNFGMLFLENW